MKLRGKAGHVFSGCQGPSRARMRIRIALLLLLAFNAILLAVVLRPPGTALVVRQERFERVRNQHESALKTVRQMRTLKAKLDAALQNGQEFVGENFLPRESAFSVLLADLERLASENRLRPSDIKYRLQPEEGQPNWTAVAVNLTVEGEYPDLVRFINRLEQSRLFWIIDSLSVTGAAGRALRLDLAMRTYSVPS
ncbi:MAG: type 4a pilus biogenesis protein PilO [Acidobacteria bacterium]|nr:type 4a pilus biogenesis protein PilO [Acidobacteriota bacterium]